jgi:hypothetical protein
VIRRAPLVGRTFLSAREQLSEHASASLRTGRVGFAHHALRHALVLLMLTVPALAQEKKDEKKDKPKIINASSLALVPGATKTLKLRGLALSETSAVKATLNDTDIPVTIKSKGKSEAPKPFEAPKIGDTELVIELKLPADIKPGADIALTAVTAAGPTEPFTLRIADPANTFEEKEPNGGFKTAQELPRGKTLLGSIEAPDDVDVYKVGGRAGERLVAEVTAQRKGSLLDASLTLYDAAGHILATADDTGDSRDPILRATLPSNGVYYLSVIDANDRGSSAHAYELTVRDGQR